MRPRAEKTVAANGPTVERNLAGLAGISELLEQGGTAHVVETVLAGLDREVKEVSPLRYRCRCSRERLLQHLVMLTEEDREYLRREDGTIDADCVFCGTHYLFTAADLVQ
jgi:molecular chaperone Hsp33